MSDKKQLTPEDVLIECLTEAERIQDIVIVVYTKDKTYEHWSNNLPSHVRLGLLSISDEMVKERFNENKNEEDT